MNSERWQTQAEEELSAFLQAHGAPERVEVLVCDCNGVFRGKWFPGGDLRKLVLAGTNFPLSLLFGDLTCETPAALLQPPMAGDPDGVFHYVLGSLRAIPWREVSSAQVQLSHISGPDLDPRHLLEAIVQRVDFKGHVAFEGEFVLEPHPSILAGGQVYSHQALEEAEPFINRLYKLAEQQGVELTSVLPEYGNGQFEVNLRHRSSALQAADEYMLAKRVIKAAAFQFGKSASFMALPGNAAEGNGCHIHISFLDDDAQNVLADDRAVQAAAKGLLDTVGDCMALLAPQANSYRRLSLGSSFYAASATWGENHRGVMLRIPKSDADQRRFEFRLAGADVNPYLLGAYVIAAMSAGLTLGGKPKEEKILEGKNLTTGGELPMRWLAAIDNLDRSEFARAQFGDDFVSTYVRMKRAEEQKFHSLVTNMDTAWASNVV